MTYEPPRLQKLQTAANELFAAHEKARLQKLPGVYDLAAFAAIIEFEGKNLNPDSPGSNADLAAAIQLSHQKVHRAVSRKIQELFDGGLSAAEIASTTGYPPFLVALVLRGAPPGPKS